MEITLKNKLTIITAIGAYSHFADILLVKDLKCDICKEIKKAIAIDTSMEEYATLVLCENCITKLFEGNINEKDT